jgi:hypothetical protein
VDGYVAEEDRILERIAVVSFSRILFFSRRIIPPLGS